MNMKTNDIVLMSIELFLFVAQIVLCFFFFNYFGLNVLMFCGWIILLTALILGWQGREEFKKKGKQEKGNSWLHTQEVVSTGVYSIVRHPIYLSFALMSLTLIFISQFWLNIIMGVVLIVLIYNDMLREEHDNINKFGDVYYNYMEQVPRINILLGIIRIAKHRKKSK